MDAILILAVGYFLLKLIAAVVADPIANKILTILVIVVALVFLVIGAPPVHLGRL